MNLELLRQYLMALVSTRYNWGGDDPIGGFDCSGLASEVMVAFGVLPHGSRLSAQSLQGYLIEHGTAAMPQLGALAFYGTSDKAITHVAICLDAHLMIEAGGGNAETISEAEAIRRNAFVRLRPIQYRKDLVTVLMPKYGVNP